MSRAGFVAVGEPQVYSMADLERLPPRTSFLADWDGERVRVQKAAAGGSWHLRSRRALPAEFLIGRLLTRVYAKGTQPKAGQ